MGSDAFVARSTAYWPGMLSCALVGIFCAATLVVTLQHTRDLESSLLDRYIIRDLHIAITEAALGAVAGEANKIAASPSIAIHPTESPDTTAFANDDRISASESAARARTVLARFIDREQRDGAGVDITNSAKLRLSERVRTYLDSLKSPTRDTFRTGQAIRNELRVLANAESREIVSKAETVRMVLRSAATALIGGTLLTCFVLVGGGRSLKRRTSDLAATANSLAEKTSQLEAQAVQLKDTVARMETLNSELSLANKSLDEFAYVASHDLKSPLRGIASLTAWIREDLGSNVDVVVQGHLDKIGARISRMESLITGILEYARVGRGCARSDVVDVRVLIAEARELSAPPADVAIEIADCAWPTLHTSRTQLLQVWLNLVGNAVKHGVPHGGTVTLGCEQRGGERWFFVRDNGKGIAAPYHEKIFQAFQRLESRDEVEGVGLGLSIVRRLVHRYGGDIRVESTPGQGATFFFTWNA